MRSIGNLGGPTAAHYFLITRRADLGITLPGHSHHHVSSIPIDDFDAAFGRHPDDVMIIIKSRMADARVLQVIAAAPASLVRQFNGHLQPHGVKCRNDIADTMIQSIKTYVPQCRRRNFISIDAANYLLQWSSRTLCHERAPPVYPFLLHRWTSDDDNHAVGVRMRPFVASHTVKRLRIVHNLRGGPDG